MIFLPMDSDIHDNTSHRKFVLIAISKTKNRLDFRISNFRTKKERMKNAEH